MREGCLGENTVLSVLRAELAAGELSRIDDHMDRCADCRVLVSSLAGREPSSGVSVSELATLVRSRASEPPSSADGLSGGRGAPRLTVGTVLANRFVVEELVGAGGMAHVFRARDRQTSADVAIKVTRADGGQGDLRFERESKLLVQLTHPAIVRHIAHGRAHDETPYLAMEWLEGEDLALRLRGAPLPVEGTMQLGARIARALAAAHAAGVVHRDIKPSNIVLRHGDVAQATLIDFGVAHHDWREASLATRTGTLLGTLGYMAPEQALRAKSADARADIFSLGCVLFECLAGRRLFEGAHAVEVLAKLLTAPVPRLSEVVPGIPAALDALVVRMLDREPDLRPASCSAIADELERILADGPDELAIAPPSPDRTRARRWTPAVVAASAVVLGTIAIGLAARPRPPRLVLAPPTAAAAPLDSVIAERDVAEGSPRAPEPNAPAGEPARSAAPTDPRAADRVSPPGSPPASPTPAARATTGATARKPPVHSDPFGDFRN